MKECSVPHWSFISGIVQFFDKDMACSKIQIQYYSLIMRAHDAFLTFHNNLCGARVKYVAQIL